MSAKSFVSEPAVLDRLKRGEPLAELVDLRVDLGVADLAGHDLDGDPVSALEDELGTRDDLGFEREVLALLHGLEGLGLGGLDGAQALGVDRLG